MILAALCFLSSVRVWASGSRGPPSSESSCDSQSWLPYSLFRLSKLSASYCDLQPFLILFPHHSYPSPVLQHLFCHSPSLLLFVSQIAFSFPRTRMQAVSLSQQIAAVVVESASYISALPFPLGVAASRSHHHVRNATSAVKAAAPRNAASIGHSQIN
ncbi:hypothetical protein BC939DRAFT_61056 [Gamsiella multidivaricata]|uniref:uncharacterized protein n=1 Tax=Gamsiella multidivaricata TaxID=101098 RepID=UPI00221EAF8E|nr:uncharacterized protein BC939DRAFT_61056 [Gamsiella multidivaricata]KAI7828594.1 hypothetical protein BC939DRAFT_61056 [Gamsiella multidivaricata]